MNSEKLEQVWSEVCGQVKSYNNIDPSQINAFFSRLHPQAMSDGFLMITADNDFIKTWIERHYVEFIKRALNDLYHMPFTVIIEVDITADLPLRRLLLPPRRQPRRQPWRRRQKRLRPSALRSPRRLLPRMPQVRRKSTQAVPKRIEGR